MNRRARRRIAIVLATAALSAAVGAYKPFDRRAASKAFDAGVAAVQGSDLGGAVEAFTACLAARPGRADCEAGLALARRTLAAEESSRRAAAEAQSQALLTRLAESRAAADPPGAPAAASDEASEEDRRRAIKHWNEGIKNFQKGEYAMARDEWLLCSRFDPSSEECAAGIRRIDNTFGGGQ